MKQPKRVTVTMVGIFVLILILCRAIQAVGSREPGMEEKLVEGIPRPPVIIDIKIYTGDVSSPGIEECLAEGIPCPENALPSREYIVDLSWPGVEEMLAEDNVSLPLPKINWPGHPYVVKK